MSLCGTAHLSFLAWCKSKTTHSPCTCCPQVYFHHLHTGKRSHMGNWTRELIHLQASLAKKIYIYIYIFGMAQRLSVTLLFWMAKWICCILRHCISCHGLGVRLPSMLSKVPCCETASCASYCSFKIASQ